VVRAGIYARISSDREGDNLAVGRQVADCEALAARQGWEVAERYVDSDLSAYSGKLRPDYRRLIADIEAGAITGVVVYNLDRLHRQPRELEEFIDVCRRAGIDDKLASCQGHVDLATHHGVLTARLLGAVAAMESDDKSRRIRRKHEELAQAGRPSGCGSRPYGFEADRVTLRKAEAAVIRDCATRFLQGATLRSLCADLNTRAVPTVGGSAWTTQSLRRILRAPRISGQREHRGEIVGKASWPAIITPAQGARIRTLLDDPARRTNKSARRYLLARLLRCCHCEATLVSRPRANGERRYVCATGPNFAGCGGTTITAEALEQFVVEAVLYRLDSPELTAALTGKADDPDAERFQLEVEQSQTQLTELAETYANRVISLQEWLAARDPIEARLTAAKKQLAKVNRTTVLDDYVGNSQALRERWESLDLSRQHAIVAAVLDHLVVGPARRGYNRFDESRLTPVWRI
jgi:site-specific DNA recombinase